MRRIPVFFALLLLISGAATLQAQETLRRSVFPQFAISNGWFSDVSINNQGTATVPGVKLSFFDGAGNPLTVQTPDMGSNSSFQFDVPAGTTKVIRASGSGATEVAGYAELIAPKDAPIRATLVVRLESQGKTATQLGVPEQIPFMHYSFPAEVRSSAGIDTPMAFVNPRLSFSVTLPMDVVVTLIDSAGTVQGSKVVNLGAGQHKVAFLGGGSGLFPGLDNFVGTASVSGPDYFGLLALVFRDNTLGTVSINDGPVLAPYFLNQTAIPEVEANNSTAAAQQLPALPVVVSGTISAVDDEDFFKFTGQQGAKVRVVAELPAGSQLDSQIFLLNSASDTIALNDQNGLGGPFSPEITLPQYNGSFMMCVLPATGTYYIKLWDYWGESGGNTFTYRLHISVEAP